MHRFVVLRDGQEEVYTEYELIPNDFDNVIEFLPEIPPGPHTKEQHDEIDAWNDKLQKLMEIERARSSKIR